MQSEFEEWVGDGSDEACDLKEGRVDAAYLRRLQVSAWNAALDAALEVDGPEDCASCCDGTMWTVAKNIRALKAPHAPPVEPRHE